MGGEDLIGLAVNFRRAIAEILIIVAGVLIALGLDNWNDNRIERTLESQYLDRLLDEVTTNARTGETIIRLATQKVEPLSSVVAIVRQSRDSRSIPELVAALRSGALSLGWALPEFTDTVFEELRSTGRLGIIRDVELRAMLIAYDRNLSNAVERIDNRRSGFAQHVYGLLPPEYYYADNRFDRSAEPDLDDWTEEHLSSMVNSADFRQLLNAERNYTTFILDLMKDVQTQIEELQIALQEAVN